MLQAQQALAVISTILSVVGAIGGAAFPSVQPIIAKVQVVLTGLTALVPPTSLTNDIADLTTALTTLQSTGVVPAGTPAADALSTAIGALGKFSVTVSDFKSGQAAIIDDNFSFEGVEGVLIAVAKGGAAAQALGM
jgi:hypothetical protein